MDNLTKEQRKKNMSHIRSKGTKPERIIIDELDKRNLIFSKYDKNLPGKPDIVFYENKVVVFIDSDFWHGHPDRFIMPKTNKDYWEKKIASNKRRDKKVTSKLISAGWYVIRLWDYDIKNDLFKCLNKIFKSICRSDLVIDQKNDTI